MTAAANTATYTSTGRAIAKCKTCGRKGSIDFTVTTTHLAFNGRPASSQSVSVGDRTSGIRDRHDFDRFLYRVASHGCESGLTVKIVKGVTVMDKHCGPRCETATGPNCECACGGENHGAAHGSW